MPVHLITFHTYRAWRVDDPRGYYQRGRPGVQAPAAGLAWHRDANAKQPAVTLNAAQQNCVIAAIQDACERRGWTIYGISATPNHVHSLVGWRDGASVHDVADTLKRLAGLALTRAAGSSGHRWFGRGHDQKRVVDRKHFDYLREGYLPKHRKENGTVWIGP